MSLLRDVGYFVSARFGRSLLKQWFKGQLSDLDILKTFSNKGEEMIDSYLNSRGRLAEKSGLNTHNGLLVDVYLILVGVVSSNVLDAEACRKLGVTKHSEVVWKEGFPLQPISILAPRIVCLHEYKGCSEAFRRYLTPFLLKAEAHCVFVQGQTLVKVGKSRSEFSYIERDYENKIINPMAAIHGTSGRIKKLVAEQGRPFDGILGFSQGSIVAALLLSGWQADAAPKFQEDPLKFAITICGSELDWRSTTPGCFQGGTMKVPVLAVFGKGDITEYGRKKQKDAFVAWFDKASCTRFDHTGIHTCFSGKLPNMNKQLDVMTSFIRRHCAIAPTECLSAADKLPLVA